MRDPIEIREDTDENLVQRIANEGDHAAFALLLDRHAEKLRSAAYRFVGSETDAEDVVQEAFLKLWKNPQLWNPTLKIKFTTWFYRVVIHGAIDVLRKNSKMKVTDMETLVSKTNSPEEILDQYQREKMIEITLRELPMEMQTALNLSFYEKIPHQQSAYIMDMSLKAFQSLLMRAKAELRKRVQKQSEVSMRKYATRTI